MVRSRLVAILCASLLFSSALALSAQEMQALVDIATAVPALQSLPSGAWNIASPDLACAQYWAGISCSGGANVTSLSWFSVTLNAALPAAIGNLKALNTISIGNCGFTGQIPAAFLALPQLKSLSFLNEQISGTIPDLSGAPKLETLSIRGCTSLNGPLPASFGNLPLKTLYLADMNLAAIPDTIGSMVNLTSVSLAGSAWSSTVPAGIWTLPKLSTLYINGPFIGSLPASVSLPQISSFTIQRTSLSGSIPSGFPSTVNDISFYVNPNMNGTLPADLGSATSLTDLQVYGSPLIYGGVPSSWSNLSNMRKILLSFCGFNGTLPTDLFARMTRLKSIDVSVNSFTGPFPSGGFSGLTALDTITAVSNRFTGSLSGILTAPALAYAYLNANQFDGPLEISSAAIPQNLQWLQIASNRLTRLPDNIGDLPALRTFYAGGNRIAGTIPASVGRSASITSLELARNMLTGDVPPFRNDRSWQYISLAENSLSYCWVEPSSLTTCDLETNPDLCVCGRSVCTDAPACSNCVIGSNNTCSLPAKPNGFPTTVSSRCSSGISSNGHCCGSACSSCQSCATGTCATVPNGPFVGCNISCTNYVSGWDGLTCGVFRDNLLGNCTAGVCNADLSRCASEAGVALPSPTKTCGSASCQRSTGSTCIPMSPTSNYLSLSSLCFVNETGSCATGTCDATATCPLAPSQPKAPASAPIGGGVPSGGGSAPGGSSSPLSSGGSPSSGGSSPTSSASGNPASSNSPSSSATPSNTKASSAAKLTNTLPLLLFGVLIFSLLHAF